MATISASQAGGLQRNIVDLPSDILTNIFSYFQRELLGSYGNQQYNGLTLAEKLELLRDTQKARLVCRVFCRFASRHLCPVLTLPLEKRSLDVAKTISTNPFILEGIRVIRVLTLYRPKELAQSLELFIQRRLADLSEMDRRCSSYAETWFLGGYDSDDETVCPLSKRTYYEAMDNYNTIRDVWLQDLSHINERVDREEISEYQRILEHGHREYAKRHEEQLQLLTDDSFANSIAMLVSRIPHPCSINLTDNKWNMMFPYTDNPTLVSNDKNELLKFMSTPHDWMTIEQLGETADLAAVTLLASIPIALQRRGTTLQGLHINCFPRHKGHYNICGSSRESRWNDFETSCKQLKTVSFRREGDRKPIRHDHPQGEDKACIDKYFSAMLSSSCLEYLHLSFYSFSLHDGKRNRVVGDRHEGMTMGSAIFSTQYPHLQEVQISSISVQQAELENFCDGLGGRLRSLYIYEIELHGSWVGVIDILRTKFSTRCLEGHCTITLSSLFGGEFGRRPPKEEDAHEWLYPERLLELLKNPPPKPRLIALSERFVNGSDEMTENPLRQIKSTD